MEKNIYLTVLILLSFSALTAHSAENIQTPKTAEQIAEEERCTVPAFAKAIGHEEMWKKHNGCPTNDEHKKDE